MRLLLGFLLLVLAVWLVLVGLLAWRQESLLFHPEPLPADAALATAPDVHESWVEVPGARLSVLSLRLPEPRGVVFFLHGNAGNLQSWFVNADFYRRAGFDLVMPDYRGYGKSSGRIESEAQLHADVATVWRSVAPRYAGKRVVLLGRSLGTGLAAQLATEIQPDLTVLVSPYLSMTALAREHYPWVPPFVLRYPLRTDIALPRVRGAVLLVHGEQDPLIPPEHSRALSQLAPTARVAMIAGAAHNDLQDFAAYRDTIAAALNPSP